MKIIFIFLLLHISITSECVALTLSEAETLAISRSAFLKSEDMALKVLNSESVVQGLWSNPQLISQIGSLETANQQRSTLEFSLTQSIPVTSKYSLKRKIAEFAITHQKTKLQYFKTWLKHQVKLTMWRVYVTDELHRHGQERSRRFALIKKSLLSKPNVSIKQRVEQNVIESQLLLLEKEQDEKKHKLFLALNDLEFWIGRKVDPSEIKLLMPNLSQISKKEFSVPYSTKLLSENSDLKIALDDLKKAELDVKLKKSEQIPDLIFGGGYRQENVNPSNTFMYAIVGLNIPIWDQGINRVQVAKNKLEQQKNSLQDLEAKLDLLLKKQSELVEMSLHQIQRFPKSLLLKNERAIQEAEKGFRKGVLDASLFIQAETQSHEMIDQVYVTWMMYLENLSALLLLYNQELNWEG